MASRLALSLSTAPGRASTGDADPSMTFWTALHRAVVTPTARGGALTVGDDLHLDVTGPGHQA